METIKKINGKTYQYCGQGYWYFNVDGYAFNSLSGKIYDIAKNNANGVNLLRMYLDYFNIQPTGQDNPLINVKRGHDDKVKGFLGLRTRICKGFFYDLKYYDLTYQDRVNNFKKLTKKLNKFLNDFYKRCCNYADVYRSLQTAHRNGEITDEMYNMVDVDIKDEKRVEYCGLKDSKAKGAVVKLNKLTDDDKRYVVSYRGNTYTTMDKVRADQLKKHLGSGAKVGEFKNAKDITLTGIQIKNMFDMLE